jgi:hypothetical protein
MWNSQIRLHRCSNLVVVLHLVQKLQTYHRYWFVLLLCSFLRLWILIAESLIAYLYMAFSTSYIATGAAHLSTTTAELAFLSTVANAWVHSLNGDWLVNLPSRQYFTAFAGVYLGKEVLDDIFLPVVYCTVSLDLFWFQLYILNVHTRVVWEVAERYLIYFLREELILWLCLRGL